MTDTADVSDLNAARLPLTEAFGGDETEMFTFALERVRGQFAWKCGGLDAAGLHHRLAPSAMTIGGLLLHMATVEQLCVSRDLLGEPMPEPWAGLPHDEQFWDWAWRTGAAEPPEFVYPVWRGAADRARQAWAAALGGEGPGGPSKHQPRELLPEGTDLRLRRVMTDLLEEYLRHTGHADLIRESLDGLVGNDPEQV